MICEKTVLKQVRQMFARDAEIRSLSAYFENGTLFVQAPEATARKVFSMLCREYDFKVKPSKIGNEFAYDFIA